MNKAEKWRQVQQHVAALTEGEQDLVAVMSTVACEIFQAFEQFHWVGFYRRVDDSTLKVGPYQGTHGCLTITLDRGVCGKCAREAVTQIENDVNAIPHHIACSSASQSEIVVPVIDSAGQVRAVLDIDSTELNSFDAEDQAALEAICAEVASRYRADFDW